MFWESLSQSMWPLLVNGPSHVSCQSSTLISITASFMLGSAWCVMKTPQWGWKSHLSQGDVEWTGQWPWPGRCQHQNRVEVVILINPATGSNSQLQTLESHTCQITRVLWGTRRGWKEHEPGSQKDEPEISACYFTGDIIWLLHLSGINSEEGE